MTERTHDPGNGYDRKTQAPERETQPGRHTSQPEPKRPADVLRDGNVKASIWENERENGPAYSTTFARTWQDERTGNYRDSNSFSGTELLRLSELARSAYGRENELRQEYYREREEAEQMPERRPRDRSGRNDDAPPRRDPRDDPETFKAKRNTRDSSDGQSQGQSRGYFRRK